jgi:hypothetical protein
MKSNHPISARALRSALCALFILIAFISGYYWHGDSPSCSSYWHGDDTGFDSGWRAASFHISSTIRARMSDASLKSFYVHDIETKFYPRGSNIVQVTFLPTVTNPDDPSPVRSYAYRGDK